MARPQTNPRRVPSAIPPKPKVRSLGVLPAKRRDAAATRQRILDAALGEFAAKGLDAARIEDIAEIAGANRRMAYYYFGSKEGLYLAALEASYFQLVEIEQAIDVDNLHPIDAIEALVAAKFEHYVKYPYYVEFVKMENLYKGRHLKMSRRNTEMRAPLIRIIQRVLKRGEALGLFRKGVDPLELYLSICALGIFFFSNRHTLEIIFGKEVASPNGLARRRTLTIEIMRAYLLHPR
jgi:AcrR family transcriptional regulator